MLQGLLLLPILDLALRSCGVARYWIGVPLHLSAVCFGSGLEPVPEDQARGSLRCCFYRRHFLFLLPIRKTKKEEPQQSALCMNITLYPSSNPRVFSPLQWLNFLGR